MRSKNLLFTSVIFFTASSWVPAHDVSEKLETGKTLQNAIHSDEVKNIMRRLNSLVYEREYTELEIKKLRMKQIELLSKAANALKETAVTIPYIDSLKNLNEEDQIAFNAMANQLKELSQTLKRETEANHQKSIDATYIKLQDTCNTCHLLFRDQ
jgi:cytochrome c556